MEQAQPQKNPPAEAPGVAARRAALALVTAVTGGGRLLSELLPEAVSHLDPADRARAGRLATETLRWASRADRVLGPYLRKRPEPATHNMLRMAVWEILGDGGAAHGVVNASVAILKSVPETARQAGLANAVLRRVVRDRPDWAALPDPQLPKWLRKPFLAVYGKAGVAAIEAAHARGAPLDLTPGPGAPPDLADRLGAELLPTGSLRLREPGQVSALPGYAEGWWWVQDAAAAIPARALAPRPGERVLDLCAAPGGKTVQLASAGADVTALDISERRMGRVSENLERTRQPARLVVADALDWVPDAPFDAILLDAPCSATGTIRRHPDLPFAKEHTGFDDLREVQSAMIDRALAMLRPGGRMVYCTCSLLPEEGEAQLDAVLERHPGLRADAGALDLPGIDPAWVTPAGGLRLRPDYMADRGGMDGFFIAVLRKPADRAT